MAQQKEDWELEEEEERRHIRIERRSPQCSNKKCWVTLKSYVLIKHGIDFSRRLSLEEIDEINKSLEALELRTDHLGENDRSLPFGRLEHNTHGGSTRITARMTITGRHSSVRNVVVTLKLRVRVSNSFVLTSERGSSLFY